MKDKVTLLVEDNPRDEVLTRRTLTKSYFENAVEGIFQATPDGRFISANPALARILGYESPEELMAHRTRLATQHYVDLNCRTELERMLAEQDVVAGFECEVFRKDMSKIWTVENIRVVRDERGAPLYYEGSIEDITVRKQLEEQLRQSQKMEAISRFAGVVAHDFNNLLTAISGYSDLLLRRLRTEDRPRSYVEEIKGTVERATSLTRKLLAFSRRQVPRPEIVDLNAVVSDSEKALRQLVGEEIELLIALEPELGRIKADPGQIEQVIMNLALNACEAMPQGGSLTIETKKVFLDEKYATQNVSVSSGHYAMLAVSDTGTGMDEETQAHIFEPFFTTKEGVKGAGLGLSTVYGVVKQSVGHFSVDSKVGRGTIFRIYLPIISEVAQSDTQPAEREEMFRGTETILLVGGEEVERNLSRRVLEMKGYHVLEATGGPAAISICERHAGPIQILITDAPMPEMSGRELADHLSQLRPEMKVLYIHGHTDEAIAHEGALEREAHFIQKPFSLDHLVRKVREVLDKKQ